MGDGPGGGNGEKYPETETKRMLLLSSYTVLSLSLPAALTAALALAWCLPLALMVQAAAAYTLSIFPEIQEQQEVTIFPRERKAHKKQVWFSICFGHFCILLYPNPIPAESWFSTEFCWWILVSSPTIPIPCAHWALPAHHRSICAVPAWNQPTALTLHCAISKEVAVLCPGLVEKIPSPGLHC